MLKDFVSKTANKYHYAGIYTATETPGSGIDLKGCSSATVICLIGAITNIANSPVPSWTFTLQDSADDSTYAAVETADVLITYGKNDGAVASGVFATIDAAADDAALYSIGYIGDKRYIRVVATAADTPGNTAIAVSVVCESLQKPQDDS